MNYACKSSHIFLILDHSKSQLTNGSKRDKAVFTGVYSYIIGPVSIHVGGAVYQPGDVEGDSVAQDGRQEVGVPQALSPKVPWDQGGHQETHH